MIRVEEVSYRIAGNQILDSVSLDIAQGEYYALAGVNGSGKSTLIKILLDLIREVEAGRVFINGELNTSSNVRSVLSYLPEKFELKPEASGWDYLRFAAGIYRQKLAKGKVIKLCANLDLDEGVLSQRSATYSKGMKQKLGLISCFMLELPLVILDEPLSGLDPKARYLFKQLLRSEKQQGRTLFYSTHMLADAEEICDKFGILHQGRIVFEGTPQQCIGRFEAATLEEAYMRCISAV